MKTFKLSDIEEQEDKPKKRFKLSDIQDKEYDQSALEAGARGVGQGLFGLGDEIVGGAQAAYDVTAGDHSLKDIVERYKKRRDEERDKVKHAYEKHPAAAYTGEIGSTFVPFLGMASKVAKGAQLGSAAAKQAVKMGAAQGALGGYGQSESKNLKGDLGSAVIGAGVGGAVGGAGYKLGKKLSKIIKKPKEEGATPKVLEAVYGLPEEYSKEFIKNPKRMKAAADISTADRVSDLQANARPVVKKLLTDASKKSFKILDDHSHVDVKNGVVNAYSKAVNDMMKLYRGKVKPGSKADATIKRLMEDRNYFAKMDHLEPARVKREIIDIDAERFHPSHDPDKISTYKAAADAGVSSTLKKILENVSPKYQQQMQKENRVYGELQGWAEKRLNTPNKIGAFLKNASTNPDKLSTRDKDLLARLEKASGLDLSKDYKMSHLNELTEKQQTQGSKNVNKWAEIGSAMAAILGTAGAGPGAGAATYAVSRGIGSMIGSYIDKHGRRKGAEALEKVVKLQERLKTPEKIKSYISQEIKDGVKEGTERMLILNLLKQTQD